MIQLNNILTLSLTGAFIPVSQLGSMLDSLSYLLPAKHYLDILRGIIGMSELDLNLLFTSSFWLILLSVFFYFLGIFIFKQSMNYAKINGNTSNY